MMQRIESNHRSASVFGTLGNHLVHNNQNVTLAPPSARQGGGSISHHSLERAYQHPPTSRNMVGVQGLNQHHHSTLTLPSIHKDQNMSLSPPPQRHQQPPLHQASPGPYR